MDEQITFDALDARRLKIRVTDTQWAELAGISPSTISRIRHGKITGRFSLPLLMVALRELERG